MGDEYRRTGTRHRRHVVVFGYPEAVKAKVLGALGERGRGFEGRGAGLTGADDGEIEDGQGRWV